MSESQPPDSVTVAPHVLSRMLSAALGAVPGVARPGVVPAGRAGMLGRSTGLALHTAPDGLSVECYLVALPNTSLLTVGAAAQASIAAVLREVVGAEVRDVNVFIQDVDVPTPAGETVAHG
jgi:uncharacterized alkaline shock family protein YloU